ALELVERLRSERPRVRFELNLGGGNFKAQFRRADKSGAPLALIIGDDELARGVVAMKPLRAESGQSECPIVRLAAGVDAALARRGCWRRACTGSAASSSGRPPSSPPWRRIPRIGTWPWWRGCGWRGCRSLRGKPTARSPLSAQRHPEPSVRATTRCAATPTM